MSTTLESIIQELQNRIGQITSQYETQLALLKVQANEALQAKDIAEGIKKELKPNLKIASWKYTKDKKLKQK